MRGRAIATGVLVASLMALAAPASARAACPNEAIRAEQGTTSLPACLALEMVSPPQKSGQGALLPNAFSPEDARALFYSTAGLAETPGIQKPFGDRYVATRGAGGWATSATSPPTEAEITSGGEPIGGPFAYAGDFGSWVLLGGNQSQSGVGVFQVYTDGLAAPLQPLSPVQVPFDDSGNAEVAFSVATMGTMGTAPDLAATVLGPSIASIGYHEEDPRGLGNFEPGGDTNSYVAYRDAVGNPRFDLLTRDEAGTGNVYGGRCGSHLGGGLGSVASSPAGLLNQGAIAPGGQRIYLTTRPDQPESVGTAGPVCDTSNPLRIMSWTQTPAGPVVEPLFAGGPEEGDDLYQAASADGERVLFTTTRSLVAGDTDTPAPGASCDRDPGESSPACDLYLYDAALPAGERLIRASAGAGAGATVLSSITAASTDATHAYFVAEGVLTATANPAGATAAAGQPNLYLYERNAENPGGRTAFIGTLDPGDMGVLWGTEQAQVGGAYAVPSIGPSAQQGADGHILLLASEAALLTEDTDGGLRDVYRYDAAAETLELISQPNPGEEAPAEPAAVDVNSNFRAPHGALFATEGRWASEDGLTVGFATAEDLLSADEDEDGDPYIWKDGQLARLEGNHLEPVVSASGAQLAFTTASALLPQDGDTATDAYLVRANGGFAPPPPPPPPCNPLAEGSCRAPALAPPALGPAFVGPGNPKPKAGRPKCKKPKVRRGKRCVKKRANRKAGKHRKGGRK